MVQATPAAKVKSLILTLIVLLLSVGFGAAGTAFAQENTEGPNRIFGIVDNILLVLDGRTGEAIETVGTDSTPVGESVEAMTWHDVDGTLYAAVEVSGSSFDRLITINPITGQQTDIGGISLSDDAVDIAGLASEDGFCTALGGQMPTQ